MSIKKLMLVLSISTLLSGCSGHRDKNAPDEKAPMDSEDRRKFTFGSILGDETLVFGGDRKKKSSDGNGGGVSVNAYLWQASLEAIKFMPLVSTDANGGVIVTDWYSDTQKPSERIKVTIYIRGLELRVEAIQAIVQKQVLRGTQWVNVDESDSLTASNLENIILTKARNLRLQNK